METGAFGWGFKDSIQPVLDVYDRRINDVLANGAHGALARAQATNDALAGGDQSMASSAADITDIGLAPSLDSADTPMRDVGFQGGAEIVNLAGSPNVRQLGPEELNGTGLINVSGYSEPPSQNDSSGRASTSPTSSVMTDREFGSRAAAALNAELTKQHVLGTVYPDFNAALGAWADVAQPFQRKYDTELNSRIHAVPGGWQIGTASSNGSRCSSGSQTCTTDPQFSGAVPGGQYWGYIHTHPSTSVPLDAPDTMNYSPDNLNNGAYVSLPNGQINGWGEGLGRDRDTAYPGNVIHQYIIRQPRTS